MKTTILVLCVLLLGAAGVGAGYYGGERTEPEPMVVGNLTAGPLPPSTSTPTPKPTPSIPLSRKTPEPSTLAALTPADLEFKARNFSVEDPAGDEVRLSARVPLGWRLTSSPKLPAEVKFVDSLAERAVRVESGFAPDQTVVQSRDEIIRGLAETQPYQNDVQIKSQTEGEVEGDDGRMRLVSTLVYTYIPIDVVRYVIVRWVATGGDDKATVEMSIAGLPQDVKALNELLDQATRSVKFRD